MYSLEDLFSSAVAYCSNFSRGENIIGVSRPIAERFQKIVIDFFISNKLPNVHDIITELLRRHGNMRHRGNALDLHVRGYGFNSPCCGWFQSKFISLSQ